MDAPSNGHQRLSFGLFEADLSSGELRKRGQIVHLQVQPFQLLSMLLERPGEVVTREEVRKKLWPDGTFVDFDEGLDTALKKLRHALGDSAQNPTFIETIPRRGYRFMLPVTTNNGQAIATSDNAGRAKQTHQWRFLATVIAVMVTAAVAAGGYFYFYRTPKLTDKDTIVLADFANTTGDPVFDGTLKQGLAVQLEQSPFLSIISDQQIQQTLQMMGQKPDARLTPQVARELCQRTASAAVLDGSIAQTGSRYLLTLKAVSCVSGEWLASTEAQASDKNHVFDALGKTASEIRNKLGELLSTVQNFDTPLERATTPSLEALQAYSLAVKSMKGKGGYDAAVPFLQRAIRLDPNFAMAYAVLALANLGSDSTTENLSKAYELRGQVTERERFYIEAHYYQQVIDDAGKTRELYELWAQTYPRDATPHNNLGVIYISLGHYEKALQELREAVRLEPTSGMYYANLVGGYLYLNRPVEARAVVEEAQAKRLDSPGLHFRLYQIAFLLDDTAGMAQQVTQLSGQSGAEDIVLNMEAKTAAYFGELRKAREFTRRAVTSAERARGNERRDSYEAEAALREALCGNVRAARTWATSTLSTDWGYEEALLLALIGEPARAQKLLDTLAKQRYSGSTLAQFAWAPIIQAQLALNRNDAQKAIEALQAAEPYELGTTAGLYPVFVRGKAYVAVHEGKKAALEFQKILDHRSVAQNELIVALVHLGLARAYVLQGDTVKARAAYQDFLTLWKDADPDIPILIAAKSEYAKLK